MHDDARIAIRTDDRNRAIFRIERREQIEAGRAHVQHIDIGTIGKRSRCSGCAIRGSHLSFGARHFIDGVNDPATIDGIKHAIAGRCADDSITHIAAVASTRKRAGSIRTRRVRIAIIRIHCAFVDIGARQTIPDKAAVARTRE